MKNIIDHIIKSRAILSPLSGISDLPFRMLCRKFGCKFAFTEMVDANAILYAKESSFRMLNTEDKDRPLGLQLLEADENKLLAAARKGQENGVFSLVDINMGCPVKKVTKKKKGVALMTDAKQAAKTIRTLVNGLDIPVSIKIRSGYDDENRNCAEIAKIAEEEGAQAVFFHPRTGSQKYKGHICIEEIEHVKSAINIPLIVSGDLFTSDVIVDRLKNTSCDAVAVARGSFGQPWIFQEIEQKLNNEDVTEITLDVRFSVIKEHFSFFCKQFPLRVALPRMHKHILWYLKGCKEINIGDQMKKYKKEVETEEAFHRFIDNLEYSSNIQS